MDRIRLAVIGGMKVEGLAVLEAKWQVFHLG